VSRGRGSLETATGGKPRKIGGDRARIPGVGVTTERNHGKQTSPWQIGCHPRPWGLCMRAKSSTSRSCQNCAENGDSMNSSLVARRSYAPAHNGSPINPAGDQLRRKESDKHAVAESTAQQMSAAANNGRGGTREKSHWVMTNADIWTLGARMVGRAWA